MKEKNVIITFTYGKFKILYNGPKSGIIQAIKDFMEIVDKKKIKLVKS